MNQALRDRVVLVTGGGGGLGAAICRELAAEGAIVIAADLRSEGAAEVARGINDRGGKAIALTADVGEAAEAEGLVVRALEQFGSLDVLVNNAGTDVTLPLKALSIEQWDRVLSTNLRGPFLLAKAVLPAMQRQGSGHIVNITSTAARRAWPNASAYHASKWGLLGFSHALHAELRPHGIKVTAIIVGGMKTPFLLDRFPDIDVGTLQDPANVARAVRFVICQPTETVIPEIMVLPMRETSWP
jgi:NAD(P)-dependent dehydrogenase (short-subunit alcohol dehydrogenase family)